MRHSLLLMVLLLSPLAGCDGPRGSKVANSPPAALGGARHLLATSPAEQADLHLAYAHSLALAVTPAKLQAHYDAARDQCLGTASLHCILLQASISGDADATTAHLQLRLPHDQVAAFTTLLTAPLPGEAGSPRVIRQSTTADDLSRPTADAATRLAQLTDYRTSLKAFESRLTISVADLVKIAGELSQVQAQIEAVQAEQRDLAQRVGTELLDVDFEQASPPPVADDPVHAALSRSRALFRASLASMIDVSVEILPWVPLGLIGLLLLAMVRRVVAGRRR